MSKRDTTGKDSDNCFQERVSLTSHPTLNTRLDKCYCSSLFDAVFIFVQTVAVTTSYLLLEYLPRKVRRTLATTQLPSVTMSGVTTEYM